MIYKTDNPWGDEASAKKRRKTREPHPFTQYGHAGESAIPEEEREEFEKYWYQRGLNFLVRREHSAVEMMEKLTQRGCPDWLADRLIARFKELNYLSLERFAYSYSKNRADLGYGPIRTRYELGYHDIPGNAIDEAFAEVDWESAREIAERKIRQDDPIKRRQALYRRGFSD